MNKENKIKLVLKNIFTYKIFAWLPVIALILLFGVYLYGRYGQSQQPTMENVQMSMAVKSIEEAHEVDFLNVGLEVVESKETNTKIPWTNLKIPATEKRALIILNYTAKFGIRSTVKINKKSDKSYEVVVPKYEYLGIELDEKSPYRVYDKSGSLLSGLTSDIDTGQLAIAGLTSAKKVAYIKQYTSQINISAKAYYTQLFKGINPDMKLSFKFEGQV